MYCPTEFQVKGNIAIGKLKSDPAHPSVFIIDSVKKAIKSFDLVLIDEKNDLKIPVKSRIQSQCEIVSE